MLVSSIGPVLQKPHKNIYRILYLRPQLVNTKNITPPIYEEVRTIPNQLYQYSCSSQDNQFHKTKKEPESNYFYIHLSWMYINQADLRKYHTKHFKTPFEEVAGQLKRGGEVIAVRWKSFVAFLCIKIKNVRFDQI